MALKSRIVLIDADTIVVLVALEQWRAGNRTIGGSVTVRTQTFIDKVLADANSSHFIIFVQGENHDNYRKKLYPKYKEHRKPLEAVDHWKPVILNAMLKYNPVILKNLESDDAVSIYANATKNPYLIISADKDLNGIPGIHFNPFKRNATRDEQWYNVTEEQAEIQRWAQIAAGDGTDASLKDTGIDGIGMGTKGKPGKAHKMLANTPVPLYRAKIAEEYMAKYGVVEGLERMALTYKVIHIMEKPVDNLKESSEILTVVPTKYIKATDNLFV